MRHNVRKKLFAVAAGLLLGAAPLLALDVWMSSLIERQGQGDANSSARRALSLAERRTAQTEVVLERLVKRGPPNCSADYLAILRAVVFDAPSLREISVLDASGVALCTSSGVPTTGRRLLTSEALSGSTDLMIEVVDAGIGIEMVRIRSATGGLAALIPSELFLPEVTTSGADFAAYARVSTSGGMEIAMSGGLSSDMSEHIRSQLRSERYGYAVDVAIPRAPWTAKLAELRWMSAFPIGGVALILIGMACLRPRRDTTNPVEEIKRALANGEFIPYYQPIVDIRSGQLRGAEVLMRWRKPDGTIVPPAAFIPLAETSGLIREMTIALMKKVCVEAGPALGRRRAMKISFNFAAQFFSDDSIVKQVQHIFSRSPIKLSQVVFELTERDSIDNFTETRRVVAALQGLGARIAIDDVGTGHSGLSYMLKLGVDIIKIDKMFVDAIGSDRNSTTIVGTLVDLANNMRMDIIAEGVETFEQVIHLRELGIRHAQGYVFAPPLPGSSFLQLVEAIDPDKVQRGADAAPEAATALAG